MGRHTYRIREIAVQAGLSEATVDRVLNKRVNVRASTEREVYQAIADLDRQQSQLRLTGRTFLVDVVMQTPERFSTAVRSALEAEPPTYDPPSSGRPPRLRRDGQQRSRPGRADRAAGHLRLPHHHACTQGPPGADHRLAVDRPCHHPVQRAGTTGRLNAEGFLMAAPR
jgi:hypothetical protein